MGGRMNERVRVTRLGIVLLAILVVSLLAVFFGSKTLQGIGFVLALLVVLILVGGALPRMRVFGRSPYTPGTVIPPDDSPTPEPKPAPEAGVPSERVWAAEEARYRDKNRGGRSPRPSARWRRPG
jgi:hypothetical protein